jgi:hypothetical protein
MSTPRGQLRPDKPGCERPPSERARAASRGWQRVAHAASRLSTIIGAASAAGQSATAFADDCESASSRTPAGCGFSVVRKEDPSPSSIRRPVQRLEGRQLRSQALSPFLSPVPLFKGCDKLTLTLTANRGRGHEADRAGHSQRPGDHGRHARVRRHPRAAHDAARLPRGGAAVVRVPGRFPDRHQGAGRSRLGAGQGGAPRPCAFCLTSAFRGIRNESSSDMM